MKPAPCDPRRRPTIIAIFPIPTFCRWNWDDAFIAAAIEGMPELPDVRRVRFSENMRSVTLTQRS